MNWYDDDDDYKIRSKRLSELKKKRNKRIEEVKSRNIIRIQELSAEEIRSQGSELLKKIISVIPKYTSLWSGIHKNKSGIYFSDGKQVIRIRLQLRPACVVDYVVAAFRVKGWNAKHIYSTCPDQNDFDLLDLRFPEDWLKRVLCIGEYKKDVQV